ncbi:MAG: tetratricopeptide repeat protein [Desulfobulbus sp.]|nr:tetratricopeptide repeat protein [Desulfobulbus sp.]
MQSRLVVLGCGVLLTLLMVVAPCKAEDLPTPVRLVLAKAAPMMSVKEYGKAAAVLEPALAKSETRHAELAFALGNCRLLRGDRAGAIKAYIEAVELDPNHAHAWLNLAKAQYEAKAYKEAGRCFAKGYGAEQPKKADNLYFSASAYLMAGAHREAISSFERLFAASKSIKPEWREQYIHALVDGGQSKRAVPLIRDLIAHSTGVQQSRWQEVLLSQYVRLNMHSEGAAFARQLIDQQPDQARWWKALAHIQLAANDYEDALSALIAYSMLKPLSLQENQLLADLYLQTGIPAKAVPFFSRQLQAKSDSRTAQRLAMAYQRMDQPAKALEILHRYRNLEVDPRLLMLQGEICYSLQRYVDAATSYRRAAGLKGGHQGQSWLMAGYAAMQAQDFEASRQALSKAVQFDREKKAATLALSQVKQQMVQ